MSKKLFVVGTGTEVGKTYISSLIIKKLHSAGINVAYYKAAMSGNAKTENGEIIPGDACFVKKISGIQQPLSEMYIYEMPCFLQITLKQEGNYANMRIIKEEFKKACEKYCYVMTEVPTDTKVSIDIVCPIRLGRKPTISEDLVKILVSIHIYLRFRTINNKLYRLYQELYEAKNGGF